MLSVVKFPILGNNAYRILASNTFTYYPLRLSGNYGAINTVLTNGKQIFYVLNGTAPDAPKEVRLFNWKDHSDKKITSLKASRTTFISLCVCNGKYLFYTVLSEGGPCALYRLTISSGKTKKIIPDASIIKYGYGKYVSWREPGDMWTNVPVYVMNKDGTGVKKIAKAISAAIYKKNIYFVKCISCKKGKNYVKIYRCDLNGKNIKAVTKTINYFSIPSKYKKVGIIH